VTGTWMRLAELALRVVPPLLRAARRDTLATDVDERRSELRREIQRMRDDRTKAKFR
jgi:hypothetical protein